MASRAVHAWKKWVHTTRDLGWRYRTWCGREVDGQSQAFEETTCLDCLRARLSFKTWDAAMAARDAQEAHDLLRRREAQRQRAAGKRKRHAPH